MPGCYGGLRADRDDLAAEPRRPRYETTVSGEELRSSLEERIDARLAVEPEAA